MSFTKLLGSKAQKKGFFLDVNNPQVIFFQAMRNSGKGVAKERCVEKYWAAGMTVSDLWAARNCENWFYAYNNNCKKKWQIIMKMLRYVSAQKTKSVDYNFFMKEMDFYNKEMFDFFINEAMDNKWFRSDGITIDITNIGENVALNEPLHCNCSRAYPILAIVPDYVNISQESIDNFNKQYFWDYHEYSEYFIKGLVHEMLPKSTNFWKVEKPAHLQQELLKVEHFTVPTPAKKDIFIDQFIRHLLKARQEHRILVMNPMTFIEDDKFKTLAAIINEVPIIAQKYFIPETEEKVGKPRHEWSLAQKSFWKWAVVLGEMKTIAPSQKMSGDVKSKDTKRALFDKISEWRHFPSWLLGDYQNPQDLFDGVRYQADLTVIKRASRNILGPDFAWLFDEIDEKREQEYLKRRIPLEIVKNKPWEIDQGIHMAVTKKFPRIQNLPDNKGIVTNIDNSWYYLNFPSNDHHHKHTKDNFNNCFKLEWSMTDTIAGTVIDGKTVKEEKESEKDEKPSKLDKKKKHNELMERIDYMLKTKKMKMPEIAKELTPVDKWEAMTEDERDKERKRLWTAHNRWIEDALNAAHLK